MVSYLSGFHLMLPPDVRPVGQSHQYRGGKYSGIGNILNPSTLILLFHKGGDIVQRGLHRSMPQRSLILGGKTGDGRLYWIATSPDSEAVDDNEEKEWGEGKG